MPNIAREIIEQQRHWNAKWCWTGHETHPWNIYVYFRRQFDLTSEPRAALVRITADARYTLYVNGQRVHQGPARCYPQHQSYDTLDLRDLLKIGPNVIAVIAHQFGVPTFQSCFRDASGFLLDGEVETEAGSVHIGTPSSWRVRPAAGWRKNTARQSIQLGFQEHFDADADPANWMSPDYQPTDEQGWHDPWLIGPVGTHPWLLMEPRGVPLLADHVEDFTAAVAQFKGENPRAYKVVDDVYHLVKPEDMKRGDSITDATAMLHNDDTVTTVPACTEGEFVAVTLSTGVYRTGHWMIDIADAAGDEIIDVLFGEALDKKTQLPVLLPTSSGCKESQAVRYRCRPGAQQWESFHFIGMRYVLVIFRNVENKDRPLKIRRLAVRQVHAAVEESGSFTCSDDRLNQIWEVGKRTQLNCMFDAFVDCPWREQAMWWGDSRVQSRVTIHAFGDSSLLERGIRLLAQSQTPDGALHAHPPADIPRHRLPDFMMTWIGTLADHFQQTARLDLIRECLPMVHRLMQFMAAHEGPQHLIGGFDGYWMFLDWQDIFKGDYSAPFNLMYLQTLRSAEQFSRMTGDHQHADRYAERAKAVQGAIEEYFWDSKTNTWRDGFDIKANKPIEQISQHTHTLAILLGLKPETHAAIARDVLAKSALAKRTKVLTGSPFFYAYILDALLSQSLHAEALHIIREKWGTFLDDGASTFYEQWKPGASYCHAWSSSPVYLLHQLVLGVRSTEPGWRKVRIAPFVGELEFARGSVPTPLGNIGVDWEKGGEDQLVVRVEIPQGMTATFEAPGGPVTELESGVHEFHT